MHFQTIINASPDIIVLKDENSRWITANHTALEIFGIHEDAYIGKTDLEIGQLYPHFAQYVPYFYKSDAQAWEAGKQISAKETVIIHNVKHIFDVIKVPIFKPSGDREAIVVIGRDITELIMNEQMSKAFFANDPDGVYTLDMEGYFLNVNKKGEELSGYSRDELIGRHFHHLIAAERVPLALESFNKVLMGNSQSLETQIVRKDGEIREFKLTTIPAKISDSVIGIQGIAQDITETKKLEELHKKQETILSRIAIGEPLETIIENIIDSIEGLSKGICSIMLYEKEHHCLRFGYGPKLHSEFKKGIDKFPIGLNYASCGHSAYTKCLKIVSDIEMDPSWSNWRKLALDYGLRACWSLPIISSKGLLLGTFAVYYHQPKEPLDADIEMLKAFSNMTGIAFEHHHHEEEIKYLANHDVLTNLPNPRYLKEMYPKIVQETNEIAIMFLDLDSLKSHNDTFGHSFGDRLIQEISKRIQETIGESNIAARMGGDEFVMLIRNITNSPTALEMAERILHSIEKPMILMEKEIISTASIGISIWGEHGQTIEELMKNADIAMYTAKRMGGNSLQMYNTHMNDEAYEGYILKGDLRKAIEKNQFELFYQPKVEVKTGRINGLEALIRWMHPEKGYINPDKFIPLAEENDFILNLGEWILDQACQQIKKWENEGLTIPIAINVSVKQLMKQDIAGMISSKLAEYKLCPSSIEIEITESVLSSYQSLIRANVAKIREIGVKVSIDDFGTGYATLTYLKQFHSDTIKIDKSFITHLPKNREDAAIVSAIMTLAKELGIRVIAEGVETKEQLDFLISKGCNEVQGYLFSHPLPTSEIFSLLKQNLICKFPF